MERDLQTMIADRTYLPFDEMRHAAYVNVTPSAVVIVKLRAYQESGERYGRKISRADLTCRVRAASRVSLSTKRLIIRLADWAERPGISHLRC